MNTQQAFHVDHATTLVIFGATGDLGKKKLFPSVWDLYERGILPEVFHVLGFARSEMSDEQFRVYVKDIIVSARPEAPMDRVEMFLEHLHYHSGLFDDVQEALDMISGSIAILTGAALAPKSGYLRNGQTAEASGHRPVRLSREV